MRAREDLGADVLRSLELKFPGVTREYEVGLELDDAQEAAEEVGASSEAPIVELSRAAMRAPLFDYQAQLSEASLHLLGARQPPENTGLLSLPTGAGKTRTAMMAVLRHLRTGENLLVLWIAPSRELLGQAAATARALWLADSRCSDVRLVRLDVGGRVVQTERTPTIAFVTPQMLGERARRGQLPRGVSALVFDEAHQMAAPTFGDAVKAVRGLGREHEPALLGLSATPGRRDDEQTEWLVAAFGGNLLRSELLKPNAIKVLQRRGILARLDFRTIPAGSTMEGAPRAATANGVECVSRLFRQIPAADRALVFGVSIRHAHAIAAVLRATGVEAWAISANTADSRRRLLLAEFEARKIRVLVCRSLLATGYDSPGIRHVVLAGRISSPILFEQIVGRACRGPAVGGVAKSTVWQFEDHLALHGLPASYHRFSEFDWK